MFSGIRRHDGALGLRRWIITPLFLFSNFSQNKTKRFRVKGKISKTGINIEHYPKISKEKQEYYLKLLKVKKKKFPESKVDKEIENESSIRP